MSFKIYEKYKTEIHAIAILTVILFLTNILFVTGNLYNSDSSFRVFREPGVDYVISSGRWAYGLYRYIHFNSSVNPFLIVIYSGLWLSISAIVFIKSLLNDNVSLKNYVFAGLPFVTLFVLTPLFIYGSDADAYSFSIMLSIIGGYLYIKYNTFSWQRILAILLVAFSIGIYQSFLHFFIITVLANVLINADKISFRKLLFDLVMLLINILLIATTYLIILKLSLFITNSELSNYRNANDMTILSVIKKFNMIFHYAPRMFWWFMTSQVYKVNIFVLSVINIGFAYMIIRGNNVTNLLKRTFLVMLIFISMFYVVALESPDGFGFYRVMRYTGLITYFSLTAILLILKNYGIINKVITIAMLVFVVMNVSLTNQLYHYRNIYNSQIETRLTNLYFEIITSEGYDNSKLIYVSDFDLLDNVLSPNSEFYDLKSTFNITEISFLRDNFLEYSPSFHIKELNRTLHRIGVPIRFSLLPKSIDVPEKKDGSLIIDCIEKYCIIY